MSGFSSAWNTMEWKLEYLITLDKGSSGCCMETLTMEAFTETLCRSGIVDHVDLCPAGPLPSPDQLILLSVRWAVNQKYSSMHYFWSTCEQFLMLLSLLCIIHCKADNYTSIFFPRKLCHFGYICISLSESQWNAIFISILCINRIILIRLIKYDHSN